MSVPDARRDLCLNLDGMRNEPKANEINTTEVHTIATMSHRRFACYGHFAMNEHRRAYVECPLAPAAGTSHLRQTWLVGRHGHADVVLLDKQDVSDRGLRWVARRAAVASQLGLARLLLNQCWRGRLFGPGEDFHDSMHAGIRSTARHCDTYWAGLAVRGGTS